MEQISPDIASKEDTAQMILDNTNRIADAEVAIHRIRTDVAELKSDVAELKSDVADLKSDVAVLKSDVAELKSGINARLDRIEALLVAHIEGSPRENIF